MISYDNAVEQRIRVGQLLYVADVLEHYGVIDADSDMVTVGVRDAEGKETVLHIPCICLLYTSQRGSAENRGQHKA